MGNTPLVEKNTFTFDKVFGISTPQDLFYQEVAQNIVSSCFKGINGTLIAYGQTGAGKTWSIEGNKEMPGIIPYACFEIFDTIDRHHHGSPSDTFLVRCSYLEIYNESVYDLLCVKDHEMPAHHNAAKPPPILSVHEDTSKHNFFAAGLTERVVTSKQELEDLIHEGSQRRSVGKTNMNATSSRSHSILKIWIERASNNTAQRSITSACLRFVDLAGSERGDKTGATGSTAKEGSYINRSLSALGDVIHELEKKSKLAAAAKPVIGCHISYRNSALTKLLSDSLGGNSRTVMVASIGPATSNEAETLSTLRFAKRVKSVKNKPKVNEDPKDTKLRELQREVTRLKSQVSAESSVVVVDKRSADLYKRAVQNLEEEHAQVERLKELAEKERVAKLMK